jgi:hypothetical protein
MGKVKQFYMSQTMDDMGGASPDTFDDVEKSVGYALWEITKCIALLEKYRTEARKNRKEIIKLASNLTDIAENQ